MQSYNHVVSHYYLSDNFVNYCLLNLLAYPKKYNKEIKANIKYNYCISGLPFIYGLIYRA